MNLFVACTFTFSTRFFLWYVSEPINKWASLKTSRGNGKTRNGKLGAPWEMIWGMGLGILGNGSGDNTGSNSVNTLGNTSGTPQKIP